jgi:predicted aspartyl protease
MGVFHVNCFVRSITSSGDEIEVSKLIVDSGSECTWIPEEELKKAGITVRKRDVPFVIANGQVVTRDVGYAILRCQEFETVDEVVFAREGDLRLLGSRTLEGFRVVLDAREKKLVAAGPYPAAGA